LRKITIKIIVSAIAGGIFISPVFAGQIGSGGVKNIRSNGSISGNPSHKIECATGSRIIIRKNDTWTDSLGYSFSNRYWNMSLEKLAEEMCK